MDQPIRPLSFSKILDEIYLAAAEGVGRRAGRHAGNADWLFRLSPDAEASPQANAFEHRAYLEAEEDAARAPSMREEDRVEAELALSEAATIGELKHIRRAFASRNHPDLFKPGARAKAALRMKIANMLIDRRRKEIEAQR